MDQRVTHKQGGIPTFFDAYLANLIDYFSGTEAVHGWKFEPGATPGTDSGNAAIGLQWLRQFLAKHDHERFVSYGARRAIDPRYACDIGPFELAMSQGVGGCLEWMGEPLFKTVFDFALI
ncbi:MAG: hypothetical protein JNG88_19070, partial [Phycisphaerales bacterium]|nr:hypothetical protein [Phycisphaerales bacterium]